MPSQLDKKAYIVAVDMGYGHQRAVFPLIEMSTTPTAWNIDKPFIITANDYPPFPALTSSSGYVREKSMKAFQGSRAFQFLEKEFSI